MFNNATLAFNRSDTLSFSGNISGTGGLTKLGAGTLTLTGANTYSGLTRVNGGSLVLTDAGFMANSSGYALGNGAVLDARSLTGGLGLVNGQMLSGNGSILGTVSIGDGAVLSPGDSIGVLAFGNALFFSPLANTFMEVSKLPLTNDQICAQSIVFGGSLVVNQSGTAPFTGGEAFRLFSVGTSASTFASISLPDLNQGLVWNTSSLYVDGMISVSSTNPPFISDWSATGTNLVLSGSGGDPKGTYYVLVSTNVTSPTAQWTCLATNQFDAGGSFAFSIPIDPACPVRFCRLQVP